MAGVSESGALGSCRPPGAPVLDDAQRARLLAYEGAIELLLLVGRMPPAEAPGHFEYVSQLVTRIATAHSATGDVSDRDRASALLELQQQTRATLGARQLAALGGTH